MPHIHIPIDFTVSDYQELLNNAPLYDKLAGVYFSDGAPYSQVRDGLTRTEISISNSGGGNDEPIIDIGPLRGLIGLQILDATHNHIEDVGPLARLVSLRRLSISSNRICDFSPIDHLEIDSLNILHQDCETNLLEQIRELRELVLNLENDQISDSFALHVDNEVLESRLHNLEITHRIDIQELNDVISGLENQVATLKLKNVTASGYHRGLEISARKLQEYYSTSDAFLSERFKLIKNRFGDLKRLFESN